MFSPAMDIIATVYYVKPVQRLNRGDESSNFRGRRSEETHERAKGLDNLLSIKPLSQQF